LTEIERIRKADTAMHGFQAIRKRVDRLVVEDIIAPIRSIDKGELDGYYFKDGQWRKREKKSQG